MAIAAPKRSGLQTAPGQAEMEGNPRSRSAHLRAAVKIAFDTRAAESSGVDA